MSNSTRHPECPLRHENGNCLPHGGFCTAVNENVCEAMHQAYDAGRKAEPVRHGKWVMVKRGEQHNHYQCSECGFYLITSGKLIRKENYCIHCGAKMEVEN